MIKGILSNLFKFNNKPKQPKLLSPIKVKDIPLLKITILVDFIQINENQKIKMTRVVNYHLYQ